MKRIFFILLFIFIAGEGLAFSPAIQGAINSTATPAGGSCDPATNEIGTRTASTDHYGFITSTQAICVQWTADCTGTLGYAYAYHYGASAGTGKICAYSEADADIEPDASDLLLGCSGEFTSSTDQEWAKSASKVAGSVAVTSGTTYWLCLYGNTFHYYGYHNLSKSWWYKDSSLNYAAPSADLSFTPVETGYREVIMYVEIE